MADHDGYWRKLTFTYFVDLKAWLPTSMLSYLNENQRVSMAAKPALS